VFKQFEKYKGIHPGFVIDRELKKRAFKQRQFALSIGEFPQTLNAITKGKRGLNAALAIKIENELGFEEGSLLFLQVFFDIRKVKESNAIKTPDLKIIHKSLFWDADYSSIDWEKHSISVIERVFDRGNDVQKEEIVRFYGKEKVKQALKITSKRKAYTVYSLNN
jgi:plasmid maintenance system antidote protein VapI